MSRVLVYGPGDRDSIPGQVIPKIQKWYLMPACFTLSHHKVRIKGKVEQSLYLGVVAIEKGAFGSSSTNVAYFNLQLIRSNF